MTYYINFIHIYCIIRCTIYEIQTVESYVTFKGHLKSKVLMQIERSYMPLYACFIETLVIAYTVSEILAQIDHKGPNWTFLTLKMAFIVIQSYLLYFRTELASHQRN